MQGEKVVIPRSEADESAQYLRPAAPDQPDAWSRQAATEGQRGGQRLLYAGEVAASARVATTFGVEVGTPVVLRRRLILLNDHPVELTDSYYPLAIAADTPLAENRKIKGGAVTLLAQLGHQPIRGDEEVGARPPSNAEAEALELPPGEWVLDVHRTAWNASGAPVEVTVMTMPARGRTLHYSIEIG